MYSKIKYRLYIIIDLVVVLWDIPFFLATVLFQLLHCSIESGSLFAPWIALCSCPRRFKSLCMRICFSKLQVPDCVGVFVVDFLSSKWILYEYEIVHDTSTHGDCLDYFGILIHNAKHSHSCLEEVKCIFYHTTSA